MIDKMDEGDEGVKVEIEDVIEEPFEETVDGKVEDKPVKKNLEVKQVKKKLKGGGGDEIYSELKGGKDIKKIVVTSFF